MMACQKCGSIIQDGLSICPVCRADLTIQSNYKKVENIVNNDNNSSKNQTVVIPSRKKSKVIYIVIVIVLIIAIFAFFLFNFFKFGKNQNNDAPKDINTVNKENVTTSSKTTTTTTTKKVEESIISGDKITVSGDNYTVPLGFEVRSSTETEMWDYYLIRVSADAMIGFKVIKEEVSLDVLLESMLSQYDLTKNNISCDKTLFEYEGIKYYKIVHVEEISKKESITHNELILEIDNNVYANVYLYNVDSYGEQNYMQTLFKFIKSRNN